MHTSNPYLPEHPVATRGLCGATPPPGEGGETFELLSPPTRAAATTLAGDL